MQSETQTESSISFDEFKSQVLEDYRVAVTSRECSLLGRREVLTGKAKFGIFGDGKEVPQLAMARAFKKGDFRSGYYRDQTFMMAINELTPEQFFAGLYADTDVENEPMSAGRQMGGHFMTPSIDENGNWLNLMEQKNSSSDISPTAGQMPRLLGLAQASKIYRNVEGIDAEKFSDKGNEVAWGTIGNASTSEGHFWETINAAGVLQVPMVMSVWDDEYGISVHAKHQTTKENISEILKGFQRDEEDKGYEILVVNGWDYAALMDTYEKAGALARREHCPVLIHVVELTQPQGHSTSGSHERYKSEERLKWEKEHDCNLKLRNWIIENDFATEDQMVDLEKQIKKTVRNAKQKAWNAYLKPMMEKKRSLLKILDQVLEESANANFIKPIREELKGNREPLKKDIVSAGRRTLRFLIGENSSSRTELLNWLKDYEAVTEADYSSTLYKEENFTEEVLPSYSDETTEVDARIILRDNFDTIFSKRPETLIFGEDAGEIGDVNQGLEGLQKKFGAFRVSDTGIREATILGQGIGMAMRGLRPIAEIQYLDYIMYCLQTMSDDLATLHYRTRGRQKAPLIVRTRGHRLEGIWHSGSQMGGLLNLLRGMYLLVPRNMTKAAGFYNQLLDLDTPALIVECLNGYRLKEKMPENLGEFKTPIGKVETLKEGKDITLVSYGSTLRIVEQVARELGEVDIDAEVIDVQSLLPFDVNHDIVKSVEKTNRLLVIDEDVPGGASAYILQEIMEKQDAWRYLDSKPQTLTAKEHRPAYGSDGDYFSKPSPEDIFEKIYAIMHEANPEKYPSLR
ncbi:alpha-ketoacid dehydrogenase subunit alpha/beta [Christiangramia flava]|uniref:3-methyl-2-oxobutanoate dehydrogenase (2-methylpropanoyl-transferring) n=1 Tax=Christiangramia flava JLT2011 TaxID=1229726 RepID=A0A1L7HZT5_9FLAO|nr:alpha-ketoacid dehydrogenase subunit alpha/beta [Christiangramia flava]APU66856.1 Branched-chain alpha-keto acid dehydrogenase, E1 component, alpha subunit [Christiangramia flava JLT2011]OSS37482.1 Branched-chain alpha-keto acid dehydrogenase, E1 component, alpha subunit [Christiangramia flava JLT2011]